MNLIDRIECKNNAALFLNICMDVVGTAYASGSIPQACKTYIASRKPLIVWQDLISGGPCRDIAEANAHARKIGRQIIFPSTIRAARQPSNAYPYHDWLDAVNSSIEKLRFTLDVVQKNHNKTKTWKNDIEVVNRNGFPVCQQKIIALCEHIEERKEAIYTQILRMSEGVLTRAEILKRGRHLRLEEFRDGRIIAMFLALRKLNDSKWRNLLAKVDDHGRIRNGFKFHGCVTGRATSDCLHSLTGDEIAGILPAGQYTWFDFRHIGAQIMAFVADDREAYQQITQRDDYYEMFGNVLKIDSPKEAKVVVLGCQYGLGARSLSEKLQIAPDRAENLVARFRYHRPKVVIFWRTIFESAKDVLKKMPKNKYFRLEGNDLVMTTPHGRDIFYANACVFSKPYESKIAYQHPGGAIRELFPHRLTQNYCDAIGYDLLGEFMEFWEDKGQKVIYHRHDEVGLEGPVDLPQFDSQISMTVKLKKKALVIQ